MITREQIKIGIRQKIVRFIVDPNMECGTVCEIGEHWFYFGGEAAEEENPDEFLKNADMDEVVSGIVEALLDIKKVDDYEYGYYEDKLRETVCIDYEERSSGEFAKEKMVDFIDTFIRLAQDVPHNDSDIIEMLLKLFTRKDLEKYGFGDFIRPYFEGSEAGEVVIVVEGGMVSGVYSNDEKLTVAILDTDTDDAEREEEIEEEKAELQARVVAGKLFDVL